MIDWVAVEFEWWNHRLTTMTTLPRMMMMMVWEANPHAKNRKTTGEENKYHGQVRSGQSRSGRVRLCMDVRVNVWARREVDRPPVWQETARVLVHHQTPLHPASEWCQCSCYYLTKRTMICCCSAVSNVAVVLAVVDGWWRTDSLRCLGFQRRVIALLFFVPYVKDRLRIGWG